MSTHQPTFQIFTDKAGEFRWRLRAVNGQVIADSGEGYQRLADCEHGISLVQQSSGYAVTREG